MGNQRGSGLHLIFVAFFLVAIITNACLGTRNITVTCFEHERLALLEFKHSVQYTMEMMSSWVGNDCCLWERVQCDVATGHVESLHLGAGTTNYYYYVRREEYLLSHEVKSSLAELKYLKDLDLSGNFFQGSQIPEFIGSFKQLTYLNLSNSEFSGNIPHHIGNLSNLKVLDLGYNTYRPLMADDMAWISGLSSLKYLDLTYVDLSEAKNYDMVLYMIPSLEDLRLKGCLISGNIPLLNSSAKLSNIKHLDLGFNNFIGQLPRFFKNMTSLEFLDLSNFDLSRQSWNFANLLNMTRSLQEVYLASCSLHNMHLSPTHLNFSTLSNIQLLDLSDNSFEGNFPSVLTNLSSLGFLDLSYCKLNSTIPIMPNLLELDVSGNNFKHIEQLGFWRQCHLKLLSVSNNEPFIEMIDSSATNVSGCSQYAFERLYLISSLNGTIPEYLGRLTNLRGLDMSRNGLTGQIPESFVRLRLLGVLDLSYNHLNGSIPESLGRLASLKDLFLSNNHLTGPMPESLGRLVSLHEFSVSSNLLNGTIPVSVGQLTKLHHLDLSNNSLEGVISEAHFENLSVLKELSLASNNKLTFNISCEWIPPFQLTRVNLSSCKIANEFPRWLRTQRKLQVLALSNDTISGPLPTWLRKMPIIPALDLSHNKLSGPLTNLPNGGTYDVIEGRVLTTELYLQNNLFSELIPLSLCTRTNLEFLNLSKNRLTGIIPACLGNLKKLRTMILSSNRFSGVINPSSIPPSLLWLNLNDNNFGGGLPRELGNFRGLIVLDLGANKFSGNIPDWIGEVIPLVIFRLHKNNFTGRIPQSLCKNLFLQILDFAHNNLSGPIPHCLGELNGMVQGSNLLRFHIDYDEHVNQVMKGVELEYTTTLQFAINMDLSSNKLVRGIPTELTELVSLVGLNLSNNLLSGGIPENIGKMDALNSLDLSGNKLSGMIPPSMAALHFLSHLNLSHNNFSGRIPTGNQLQTLNEASIYAGNKDLCGYPLPKKCSVNEDLATTHKNSSQEAANEPKMVWFYLDITCGFATGFWGIIGILVFKKQWRHKLFMFAEGTMDKIYVAVVVTVAKMKRRNEAS